MPTARPAAAVHDIQHDQSSERRAGWRPYRVRPGLGPARAGLRQLDAAPCCCRRGRSARAGAHGSRVYTGPAVEAALRPGTDEVGGGRRAPQPDCAAS